MTRGKWFGCFASASVLLMSAEAAAQMIGLSSGFLPDPRTLQGTAGGPVQAASMGSQCVGNIPQTPQHRIVLQTPLPFLRTWVNSGTDTTLLVRAPNGMVFCADDTWGTNPGVDIVNPVAGQYDVYVGTYDIGATGPYVIGFSGSRASTPMTFGPATATPVRPAVGQGATLVAPPLTQNPPGVPPPSGPDPNAPPTAVIGTAVAPPPGSAPTPVRPPPMAPPSAGFPLQAGFTPDPHIFSGISGGPVDASAMNASCRGFVNNVPSQTLQLTTPINFLRFWVRSQSDTTLVVRAPTGQLFCADDTWGQNPGVDLNSAPAGMYEVFVGSYAEGARAPYRMAVTENPGSTPDTGFGYGSMPNPVVAPAPGPAWGQVVSLASGFTPDPQMRSGISGGPVSAMSLNPSCRGYIGLQPNHVMYLTSPFNFVRAYVQSSTDTTMMIRGPNGEVWCADDVYGLNPGIDLQGAMPGQYQVFVGSYTQGVQGPYSIGFTEMPNVHP